MLFCNNLKNIFRNLSYNKSPTGLHYIYGKLKVATVWLYLVFWESKNMCQNTFTLRSNTFFYFVIT